MPFTTLWRKNRVWMLTTLLLSALIVPLHLTGLYDAVQCSSTLGLIFLVLTLLPGNLIKLHIQKLERFTPYLSKLHKYRRDFGIVTGWMFLIHTVWSLYEYNGFSWAFLFSKPIVLGTAGIVILIILLITSNMWGLRVLKANWKMVQSLIWVLVPLGLMHGILSSMTYATDVTKPGMIAFGLVIAFVIAEVAFHKVRKQSSAHVTRHAALVTAGVVLSLLLWIFYP